MTTIQYPLATVNQLRFVVEKALGKRKHITKYELHKLAKKIKENQQFEYIALDYIEKMILRYVNLAYFDTFNEHILFLMGLYSNNKTTIDEIESEIIDTYPTLDKKVISEKFALLKANKINDITFFIPNSNDNLLKFLRNELQRN